MTVLRQLYTCINYAYSQRTKKDAKCASLKSKTKNGEESKVI